MGWLYKRDGSENWWLGYRENGRQVLRSTGTADEAEAKKQLETIDLMARAHRAGRLNDEFYRTLTASELPKATLRGEMLIWLADCKSSTGEGTALRYKSIAEQFMEYAKANDSRPMVREVTKTAVQGFLNKLRESRAPGSVNLARKVLSIFFNRCLTANPRLIDANPVRGTKKAKAESKGEKVKRRAFTPAELAKVYATAPNDFWRYMVTGGFYTGLRMGDLIQLREAEIDLPANHLRLEMEKVDGSAPLEIPMAAPFRAIVEKRLKEKGKTHRGYLWPEQAKLYQQIDSGPFSQEFYTVVLMPCGFVVPRLNKKKTKGKNGRDGKRSINELSFHSLRHSFVTLLKVTGASNAVAKRLAGHSSDVVNDLYTDLPPEVMQRAIKQLPAIDV